MFPFRYLILMRNLINFIFMLIFFDVSFYEGKYDTLSCLFLSINAEIELTLFFLFFHFRFELYDSIFFLEN